MLCPFVYEDGLVRVDGRLRHSTLYEGARHQILLSKKHHVTELIVRECHEKSGHSCYEHTMALLRATFWIIGARRLVKKCTRNCIVCLKRNAVPCQQMMTDLPHILVTSHVPPFTNTRIDVFRPYEVKIGRSDVKRYGCLFTCMASIAIHIEMLSSLDTSSLINCLRCFIASRASPTTMWSDNGTNFVSANNELNKSIAN